MKKYLVYATILVATASNAQGLEKYKSSTNSNDINEYTHAIKQCLNAVRQKIGRSDIKIYRPCPGKPGEPWHGITRITNGLEVTMDVVAPNSQSSGSLERFIKNESVIVNCEVNQNGYVTKLTDRDATIGDLFTKKNMCMMFSD
jgi:hypothetical protein